VITSLQELVVIAFGLLAAMLSTKNLAAVWRGKGVVSRGPRLSSAECFRVRAGSRRLMIDIEH
jgi:hypothetical protein